MHGGFRVALGFVVKACALGIDLHTAFHHHGPAHERTLWNSPGAVALVAAQVGQPGLELTPPEDGAAVVAGMAGKSGVAHGGQQVVDHVGVATKAIAGQQQGVAAQVFQGAVRTLVAQAQHLVGGVDPEFAHQRLGHDVGASGLRGTFQSRHQRSAGALGHGVHAAHPVAGVQKAVQHFKGDAVARFQRINRLRNGLGISAHQMGRGVAMGFGLHVLRKQAAVIFNAQRLLQARTGCRDKARRQGGGTAGAGIALQQHARHTGIAQANGRAQTAGACAHDGHLNMQRLFHRRGLFAAHDTDRVHVVFPNFFLS